MTERSTKTINRVGNSLSINITSEARALGLDRGDMVDVTIDPHKDDRIILELVSYPTLETEYQTVKVSKNGESLFNQDVVAGRYAIKGQVFRFTDHMVIRPSVRFDELVIRDATPEEVQLMTEEEPII